MHWPGAAQWAVALPRLSGLDAWLVGNTDLWVGSASCWAIAQDSPKPWCLGTAPTPNASCLSNRCSFRAQQICQVAGRDPGLLLWTRPRGILLPLAYERSSFIFLQRAPCLRCRPASVYALVIGSLPGHAEGNPIRTRPPFLVKPMVNRQIPRFHCREVHLLYPAARHP